MALDGGAGTLTADGGGALDARGAEPGGAVMGRAAAATAGGGTLTGRAAAAAATATGGGTLTGRDAAATAGGGALGARRATAGGTGVLGAGGGLVLIGETAMPTMSASSRSSVARRSRIAGGATVLASAGAELASTGPETGAGGSVDAGRAAGGAEVRGRGIDGRTRSLMARTRASCVPRATRARLEEIRHDLATPTPRRRQTAAMFLDRDA